MLLRAIEPSTGTVLAEHAEMPPDEVAAVVTRVHRAFRSWRRTSLAERAQPLWRAAALLRERCEGYGALMAREMGKPISEGEAEAVKCAWVCEFYAEHAERLLADERVATDAARSFVTYQPLGPVLAVMPWNFPFWQVFRCAAPALMAGDTVLLKHASNVPGCALAIEALWREAGLPEDVFRTLPIGAAGVRAVIERPEVAAVTLTGSEAAGRAVAAAAGAALKPTILELGGSDPYVVLEDADLSTAVPACVASRMLNGGQSCISAKRFVVVRSQLEAFERQVVEAMGRVRMGDPRDRATQLGPLARLDLRDVLHDQVQRSVAAGARLLLGGLVPSGPGAFYPPTVLSDVGPGMAAYHEETFGPVAAIVPAADDADALRIANDTSFGLGAAVFTRDAARGERIAVQELEAGCCFVNSFVRSDPRLPFGGVKTSGYGRELGRHGIRALTNTKTVYIASADGSSFGQPEADGQGTTCAEELAWP